MHLNLWSALLIIFGSQCIFLVIMLLLKPSGNRTATQMLTLLLIVIFLVNLSNFWSAAYLYRAIPRFAGFARGMVFLLGPLFYFYALAVLKPGFRLKSTDLLHFAPYLVAFILIRIQEGAVTYNIIIAATDNLMEGKVRMTPATTCWFIAYLFHLLVYIGLTRKQMILSIKDSSSNYLISSTQKLEWLKKISLGFCFTALVFLLIIVYIISTGVYSIYGNYLYILVLGSLVYLLAYQSVFDGTVITPHFERKYRSTNANEALKNEVHRKIIQLFEKEKIFEDPSLTLALLAKKLAIKTPLLSQVINEKMNHTFNELIHRYRIEAFKERVSNAGHTNYSIIGIAYDIGYNSKSAFNKAFKKQTGITPSAYMKVKAGGQSGNQR